MTAYTRQLRYRCRRSKNHRESPNGDQAQSGSVRTYRPVYTMRGIVT